MGPNPTETAVCCLLDLTIIFLNQRQAPSSSKGYFAELDAFTSDATTGDALDEWLSSPPLGTVGDPIGWWTAMETAGHPLARMSLDFLSTPGTMHCIAAHGKMLMLFVSHIHRLWTGLLTWGPHCVKDAPLPFWWVCSCRYCSIIMVLTCRSYPMRRDCYSVLG